MASWRVWCVRETHGAQQSIGSAVRTSWLDSRRSMRPTHDRRRTLSSAVIAAAIAGALASPRAARAAEQVPDGTFEGSLGAWYAYGVAAGPSLTAGALCVDAQDGTVNPWDAAIGRNDIPAIGGEGYQLSFQARASRSVVINANFQHASGAFEVIAGGTPTITTEWQ